MAGTSYSVRPTVMSISSKKTSYLVSCPAISALHPLSPPQCIGVVASRYRLGYGRNDLPDLRRAGVELSPVPPNSGPMNHGSNPRTSVTRKGLVGSRGFEPAAGTTHQAYLPHAARNARFRRDLCGNNAGVHGSSGKPVHTCDAGVVPWVPELVSTACSRGGVRGATQRVRMGVRRRPVPQEKEVILSKS